MDFMLQILVIIITYRVTECKFQVYPPTGNWLEFEPLLLQWHHTFGDIRGCVWMYAEDDISPYVPIIQYGKYEGVEIKHLGWELTNIHQPCCGGIRKKISLLTDNGIYEFRIIGGGAIIPSKAVIVKIITPTDRSIQVTSHRWTTVLLPQWDMNRTVVIEDFANISIKLNDNYPHSSCMKIRMFRRENLRRVVDVCDKTFDYDNVTDVDLTHFNVSVSLDIVNFTSFDFSILLKDTNEGRLSTNLTTVSQAMLNPNGEDVDMQITPDVPRTTNIAVNSQSGDIVVGMTSGHLSGELHVYSHEKNDWKLQNWFKLEHSAVNCVTWTVTNDILVSISETGIRLTKERSNLSRYTTKGEIIWRKNVNHLVVDIAVDSEDNIYCCCAGTQGFYIFNADGLFKSTIILDIQESVYNLPLSFCFDTNERIVVLHGGILEDSGVVNLFDKNGMFVEKLGVVGSIKKYRSKIRLWKDSSMYVSGKNEIMAFNVNLGENIVTDVACEYIYSSL